MDEGANFEIDVTNCCRSVAKYWHWFEVNSLKWGCYVKLAPHREIGFSGEWGKLQISKLVLQIYCCKSVAKYWHWFEVDISKWGCQLHGLVIKKYSMDIILKFYICKQLYFQKQNNNTRYDIHDIIILYTSCIT